MGFPRQEDWSGLPFPSPIHIHTIGLIHLYTPNRVLPQALSVADAQQITVGWIKAHSLCVQ